MPYAKDVQEMYLENVAQILFPRSTCGVTFYARFPQCFNALFKWKQRESLSQRNLCKKNTNLLIPPSSR